MSLQEKDCGLDPIYKATTAELEEMFTFLEERLLPMDTETEVNRLNVWFLSVEAAHFPWECCSNTKKLERLGELDTIRSDLHFVAGDILDLRD